MGYAKNYYNDEFAIVAMETRRYTDDGFSLHVAEKDKLYFAPDDITATAAKTLVAKGWARLASKKEILKAKKDKTESILNEVFYDTLALAHRGEI